MKKIQLTKGFCAMVDDEYFEELNLFNWHVVGNKKSLYAARAVYKNGNKKVIKMHRQILGLTDPKIILDHVDRNGLNNQRSNLRIANHSQNGANRSRYKPAKSIYFGVILLEPKIGTGRKNTTYRSQLCFEGIRYRKTFKTEIEAARHYNEMATKYHGEFANLNIF